MRHIIIYTVLVLVICSCGQITEKKSNIIVIDNFASAPKTISIDEVVSHIDYIQLETTQESLIGNINKLQIKDSKVYILDARHSLMLVFDMKGKFIRRIGNRGRGPGEYLGILDFALCDSVILMRDGMQMKMILYDTLGRLIAEKHIPNTFARVAFYNGMPACEHNYPDFAYNNGFRISIFDRNLNLMESILTSDLEIDELAANQIGMSHSRSFFTNVSDTLTFWECRDDVVYKIINQNQIERKYIFRYKSPAKFEDGMNRREPGCNEISGMKESRNQIFLVGRYDGEYRRLIYFKATENGICVDDKLKNNSGPDFFPEDLADDEKAYETFSVYAYKAELEKSNTSLERLDSKLQSLLRTCQFDDNPCIMLVTLK